MYLFSRYYSWTKFLYHFVNNIWFIALWPSFHVIGAPWSTSYWEVWLEDESWSFTTLRIISGSKNGSVFASERAGSRPSLYIFTYENMISVPFYLLHLWQIFLCYTQRSRGLILNRTGMGLYLPFFRLILNQTEFHLIPDLSADGQYNHSFVSVGLE